MLAHGALLRKNFFNVDQMLAIVKDFASAGLTPEEVALMKFAQKIIAHASQITPQDIDELCQFGLTDNEILDLVVVVTARSFFSKTLDALAVRPDDIYHELEPELVEAFAIGRPFS